MNQAAEIYWNEYWKNEFKPKSVTAWQLGVDPDMLLVCERFEVIHVREYLK